MCRKMYTQQGCQLRAVTSVMAKYAWFSLDAAGEIICC